mmetsp:Transcript_1538/g.2713  ORF Transcript_1538/g.2713 Transcript_1538/m.2713 type:complete len:338 (-) Transcript_1538:193-1206(-)
MFKLGLRALSAAVLCVSSVQADSKKKCTALAMSGGGAKGAYEAGALWGLYYNAKDKSEYQYDVSTGVSAGAINTAALSIFAPGDEENMLEFLTTRWQGIDDSTIYKQWKPAGIITGLNKHSGIFDSQPLSDFLTKIFEEFEWKIKRKIVVSCVDVNSGSYVVFNEKTTDIVNAVVSSASIPFIFPNVQFNASSVVCMDGGTVWNTNLVSAVERCREQVDDDSQITLDIVLCGSSKLAHWEDKNNAYANWLRFGDIKSYYDDMADILEFKQAYPQVNYRHLVAPSEPLKGGLSLLNFDNETNTYPMQMLGRLDGENAQKSGEGFYFAKLEEWAHSRAL